MKTMRQYLLGVLLGCSLALPGLAADEPPSLQAQMSLPARQDRVAVFIELTQPPAVAAYTQTLRISSAISPETAQASAVAAARSQAEVVQAAQAQLSQKLVSEGIAHQEIYRAVRALNGMAVYVSPDQVGRIAALPGVKAARVMINEYPTLSTSVPFLGTPNVWANTLGLPQGYDGTGIKIGVIDTGIDYLHATFGGTGALGNYAVNDTTTNADGFFPTAKVVGGTDFAGNAYNGGNAPVPDPDPMDCHGHGTHVASTAAGFGVKADNSAFTGPWDNTTPFGSLKIGPGTAPKALLYALRVFGCGGSTNLTVKAIEWAMDPNGDFNFSDHLDVINMSLGSPYGGLDDSSAQASEAAASVGVIVVASAGNSGDTYFITGSPGSSTRTLSVAASADDGLPGAMLVVNTPPAIAGNYLATGNSFLPSPAPAPTGQTADIVLANPANGCSLLTNAAAVAGKIALIDRGTCTFQTKAANAQAAGAIAVIIGNNAGDPIAMGGDATQPQIVIPAIMISTAARNAIVANSPANATLPGGLTAADTLASFSSRGPRLLPSRLKPDIAAPGLSITAAQSGTTPSGFIPDSAALTISGTSMAAPHMAGVMALLKQQHPSWSVEELKAVAMNGALHDITTLPSGAGLKYAPSRIGAGRVDPGKSAQSPTAAFVDDGSGAVSVTFDGEVFGSVMQTRQVRVVNRGVSTITYDLAIDPRLVVPGVSFSVPPSVTILPGSSATFLVTMTANAAQITYPRDPTVTATQLAPAPIGFLGALARHWLAEAAGYLTFSQAAVVKSRLPIYMAPRGASAMAGPLVIPTGGTASGSTTIALSGTGICTGTPGPGTCTGTFPNDEVSLVSPFELQVKHALDPGIPAYANVKYAGVAYDPINGLIRFGIAAYGRWSTPAEVAFNVYVDNNNDGTWDKVLFNSDAGNLASSLFGNSGASGQDTFINSVFTPPNNVSWTSASLYTNMSPAVRDSRLFFNDVIVLSATPGQLGVTGPFRYKIVTCPGWAPLCQEFWGFKFDEAAGPFIWNPLNQGLNFSGAAFAPDLNGATLPVAWNVANHDSNRLPEALLLHHHNAQGTTAEVISIAKLSQTITFGAAPTLFVGGSGNVTASVNSGLPLVYSSMTPTCGVNASTGQVAGISAGSCTIAVNQPGNLLYNPALQATQTFPVIAPGASQVDLSVSQSANPNPASTGKDVVFTITVANAGPGTATGVTLTDTIPAGTAFIWASPGCVNSSGTVTCNLGSITNGANKLVKVVVRPPAAGPITNSATVSGSLFDINTLNNAASATVQVNASAAGVPVTRYRLYSPVTLEHHFTTDPNEYSVLGASGNWIQEGTVGKVLNNPGSFAGVAAVPFYRLYNITTRWHFWTTDANEYYTLTQGPPWNAEGVDGFILPTQAAGTIPLYRLLYPFIPGLHHWTIDEHEYSDLINLYGWVSEPGSGYVIP